jgi:predicted secreted protein
MKDEAIHLSICFSTPHMRGARMPPDSGRLHNLAAAFLSFSFLRGLCGLERGAKRRTGVRHAFELLAMTTHE